MGPDTAIALCLAAHARLEQRISSLDDDTARQPSRLPGWSVGHVLTHLARNAEGHALRLEGALRGEEVPRYPGGGQQRDADIEAGAGRPASELMADIVATNRRLEAVWKASAEAGWPHTELMGGDSWSTSDSSSRRLREVEIHHYDLGLGYQPSEWASEYTAWELREALAGLPERLDEPGRRQLLLWLLGRDRLPENFTLGSWD